MDLKDEVACRQEGGWWPSACLAEQNNRVSVLLLLLLLQSVAGTAAAGLLIASHLLYKGRPGMKNQPKAFTKQCHEWRGNMDQNMLTLESIPDFARLYPTPAIRHSCCCSCSCAVTEKSLVLWC